MNRKKYNFAFVMSTALGNQTRYMNFRKFADLDTEVDCHWSPVSHFIPPGEFDPFKYLPRVLRARATVLYQAKEILKSPSKFDAILIHMLEVDILLALRSYIVNSPLRIISTDDAPAVNPLTYPFHPVDLHKPAWRKALRLKIDLWRSRRADFLIPFSHWAADIHITGANKPQDQITPIHVGIDLDIWPDRAARLADGNDKPKLLFVGGDFIRKGGEILVETFRKHFAHRAELHLVTKIAPSNLPPNTYVYTDFEPNDARLSLLYRSADVFILPTMSDLSSWVALEAMASGCPTITTRVGGIVDIVEEGVTGLFVTPGRPDELRTSIDLLLDDAPRRHTMGRSARRRVEGEFNASVNVPKILSVMKNLVDVKRASIISDRHAD